mmetsp:Transcript_29498/g.69582  ORF Transcript_29498/g.69582 Transcript_29498/m.69582 type:complete len:149 (-) Transcript_29498:59-505(-)
MAQPVTMAQPTMTYQGEPGVTYMPADAGPVTYVDAATGQPIQMLPAGYDYGQPVYMQDGLPPATSMIYSPYTYPAAPMDHSQGKWFAPGEELPPGFIPVAHPEGHMEPQAHHSMTDAVKSSMGMPVASAAVPKAEKKKSKKKKSSGCC